MNTSSCPDRETLTAYLRGALVEDAAKAIDEHLPDCAQCNAVLAALEDPDDKVITALRASSSPNPFAVEPEFQRAVAKLREAGAAPGEADPTQSFQPTPSTLFAPGDCLRGRYEIRRELGRGGMGVVYVAWDRDLSREVAVKVPALDRLPPGFVETFLHEARTAAGLEHPGIIRIYDFGRHAGIAFAVMQYIDGPSLKESMASQTLSHARAVEILIEIAEALHYAHKRGFIHRDLKPGNILLDKGGKPHIADFGLAIHESEQESLAGSTSGTAAYMAPEQARGQTQWLDGRADLWALGVILYEMLTHRRPFQAATPSELRDEILHREPKPLRMIDDSIPAGLEATCLKCLSKDVKGRFSSARDLVKALRKCSRRPSANGKATDPFLQRWYHQFSARLDVGRVGCAFSITVVGLLLCVTFLPLLMSKPSVVVLSGPATPTPLWTPSAAPTPSPAQGLAARDVPDGIPPSHIVLPPSAGATSLASVDAQARPIAAQGDFLESVAVARRIHAEAYAHELQSSVEEVKAYFERRRINRAAVLEEKGWRPDIIREKRQKAMESYVKRDLEDLLKHTDVSKQLNWLLAELCGPTMAVQYMGGSEALPELNERLSEDAKTQIWLTDGGRAGSRLEFRLGEGKVLETSWPPGLRRNVFDALRTEFEAARDGFVKGMEANGRVSEATRDRLIIATNDLLVTLEVVFPPAERHESSVFLEYHAAKQYLRFLVAQVNRAITTKDWLVCTGALRFQGNTIGDLLQYMYQSGLVFAPPKEGGERIYRSLVLTLRNVYVDLPSTRLPAAVVDLPSSRPPAAGVEYTGAWQIKGLSAPLNRGGMDVRQTALAAAQELMNRLGSDPKVIPVFAGEVGGPVAAVCEYDKTTRQLDGRVVAFQAGKDPITCLKARLQSILADSPRTSPGATVPTTSPGKVTPSPEGDSWEDLESCWNDVRLDAYLEYKKGHRDGVAATWNADGQRVFWGKYQRDHRHDVCCLFQNDRPRIVVVYDQGKPGSVYLVSNNRLEQSFATPEEAQRDSSAHALLDEIDNLESKFQEGQRLLAANVRKSVQGALADANWYKRSLEQMRRVARESRQKLQMQESVKAESIKAESIKAAGLK